MLLYHLEESTTLSTSVITNTVCTTVKVFVTNKMWMMPNVVPLQYWHKLIKSKHLTTLHPELVQSAHTHETPNLSSPPIWKVSLYLWPSHHHYILVVVVICTAHTISFSQKGNTTGSSPDMCHVTFVIVCCHDAVVKATLPVWRGQLVLLSRVYNARLCGRPKDNNVTTLLDEQFFHIYAKIGYAN